MNWYIAKIVFHIVSGSGEHKPQFDEQYRLIKADCLAEAFDKATIVGQGEDEMLINDRQEIVRWEFVNVSELYPVNELRDGMELFSTIHEPDEKDNFVEIVQMKAAYVQSKFEVEREKVQ